MRWFLYSSALIALATAGHAAKAPIDTAPPPPTPVELPRPVSVMTDPRTVTNAGEIAVKAAEIWQEKGAAEAAAHFASIEKTHPKFRASEGAVNFKLMGDWVLASSYADPAAAQILMDRWTEAAPIHDPADNFAIERQILQTRIWLRSGKLAEAKQALAATQAKIDAEIKTEWAAYEAKGKKRRYYDMPYSVSLLNAARIKLRLAEFLIATHERGEAAFSDFAGSSASPFFNTPSKLFIHSDIKLNCAAAGLETKDWMIAEVGMDRAQSKMIITPFAQSRDAIIQPALDALEDTNFSIEGMRNIAERQHILIRCARAAPTAENVRPDYNYLIDYFKPRQAADDPDYKFNGFYDPFEQLVRDNKWSILVNNASRVNPVMPHRKPMALQTLTAALKAEAKPDATAIAIAESWDLPEAPPGENWRLKSVIPARAAFVERLRTTPGVPPRVLAYYEFVLAEKHEIAGDVPAALALYKGIVARAPDVLPEKSPEVIKAQLRLAALADAAGKREESDAIFAALGLSPEQCSIYQARPAITSFKQPDYPSQALRDEKEGSVKFEFDLSKEGKPTNFRILASTPPLVFDARTLSSFATASFAPATRGGEALPCEAASQSFLWRIAD